ncbi:hypothetical protein EYF80_041835 [Liparis tanakae]|uniref:Uncharacterized protein n=1 Tax=Liparis tanakae TaxID=230148 RepID=A0A4Z2G506_9TELE|nr:hypothetical protein EYF80_041835 [Liparis tanakae]
MAGHDNWSLRMSTRTLESLEALQWDSGGAGDKLQQPGPPLLVKRLHGFPEPLDDVAVQGAVLQAGVGLPVSDVDLSQAAHDELELFFIEGFEQVLRDDLVEAFLQRQKLSLDAVQETPAHIQPAGGMREDVLGDRDTLAVGLELVLDDFSVGIVLDTERVVQDAGDVIVPEEGTPANNRFLNYSTTYNHSCISVLPLGVAPEIVLESRTGRLEAKRVSQDPDEAVVEVRVDGLHVVQRDGFPQQLFVEGQREASVDVVAVEHRHAHDATHEVETSMRQWPAWGCCWESSCRRIFSFCTRSLLYLGTVRHSASSGSWAGDSACWGTQGPPWSFSGGG